MTAKSLLLTAGAGVLLGLAAYAEPEPEALLSQLGVKAREQSVRAEERIHHLMQAADHLGAAGLHDEAARIRERASLLRAEHEQRLAELERLHHLRAEEQRRRELEELVQDAMAPLLERLRGELDARLEVRPEPARPRAIDPDRAGIEENNRQAFRTWQRIEESAREVRPRGPRADPPPVEVQQETGPARQEVLQQILRTLQRIEKKLEE